MDPKRRTASGCPGGGPAGRSHLRMDGLRLGAMMLHCAWRDARSARGAACGTMDRQMHLGCPNDSPKGEGARVRMHGRFPRAPRLRHAKKHGPDHRGLAAPGITWQDGPTRG
eukprot:2815475-Alexandrium_andersonii.AAC.1